MGTHPGVFDARMDPGVRRPAVLLPVAELRWLSRTWLALGLIVLGADLASGAVGDLSLLELGGSCGLLALSVAGAPGGRAVGGRAPPGRRQAKPWPAPRGRCLSAGSSRRGAPPRARAGRRSGSGSASR